MNNMNCPYCNQQLQLGYIKTKGEQLSWSANKNQKPILSSRWTVEENDIKLGTFRYPLPGGKVIAYRCEVCKKIIIDEEDSE